MPLSFFALDELQLKGPRKNVDKGDPHDYGKPFIKGMAGGSSSCGSWACSEGGWDSPSPRGSTEYFFVLSGRGCVTDPDGTPHPFGPGDTVVLPKGWYGRWDIDEFIHKVWVVTEHDDVPGAAVTPVVAPVGALAGGNLSPEPATQKGRTMYDVGSVAVGSWTCTPGTFTVESRASTELLHVLRGVAFITNSSDGSARRCAAGDTVVLPRGWSGQLDVVESFTVSFADVSDGPRSGQRTPMKGRPFSSS